LTPVTMIWIAIVPLGTLGVAAWIGIWFPYHPIPLRRRLENRRPWWHMIGRWATLTLVPYSLVPAVATAVALSSALLWHVTAAHGLSGRLSFSEFAAGVALTCAIAVAGWIGGHVVAVRMMARRKDAILAYLSDPLNG
jgi:hypothetical protein